MHTEVSQIVLNIVFDKQCQPHFEAMVILKPGLCSKARGRALEIHVLRQLPISP